MNLTRFTIGVMILVGLYFYRPLAWFTGIMMIFAGVTGVCLLDVFFRLVLGPKRSGSDGDGEPKDIGFGCG
jgi:hypothetical protein